MSLSSWESHIASTVPEATELVDLLKLPDRRGSLQLVIDGECCLDRLYGGYYPDWVCGGQWNKMDQFLCNFSSAVQNSKLDLVVFLNGSLESERLKDWCKRQEAVYKFVQEIHQHVSLKRKPPPKVWWVPPAFLRSAIRLAFRCLNMRIMCSLEDHHKDILRFVKKNHMNGIMADDSEYLIFEPDRYFSAQKLKLTFKGSLETVETKLTKLYSALNLPKDRLHIFATLLGNHIVLQTDLNAFYSALDIPDSQQKGAVIEAVSQFVRALESTEHGDVVDAVLAKSCSESATYDMFEDLRLNLTRSLKYYASIAGKNSTNTRSNSKNLQVKKSAKTTEVEVGITNCSKPSQLETESSATASALPSDDQTLEVSFTSGANGFGDGDKVGSGATETNTINTGTNAAEVQPVINGNGSGDAPSGLADKSKDGSSLTKLLYRVAPQIDNVATNRHRAGLMSPYICQILKHKEIKLPVVIEDINDVNDLPQTHLVFRPLRQRVYAILFNLHHLHFLAKERGEPVPKIEVKETYYDPAIKKAKTDVIRAIEVGWGVPTVERLWLGDGDECKRKRVRAFLSTLKSDNQILLDDSIVPQHFLVLCCVLRYLLHDRKILRESELDGLIAQALIQRMTDVNVAQDIEVSNLTMRGIHISHMFMEGVEMALLVNDACGSPIPYMLFAPWLFFNGKIFNFILEEQAVGKTIAEICGFKMDIVLDMERIKTAILDGINAHFAPNPYASNANASLLNAMIHDQFGRMPAQLTQGYIPNGMITRSSTVPGPVRRNAGGLAANPGVLRNTGYLGPMSGMSRGLSQFGCNPEVARVARQPNFMEDYMRVDRRGSGRDAQLQVAGTVVGSWGANYSQPSNSRYHPQGFYGLQTSGDYVRRNPLGNAHARGSTLLESTFRQMRISPGIKVPNKGHSTSSGSGNARGGKGQSNKQQKKSIMKNNENAATAGARTETTGDAAVAGNSSKTKAVSFVDEEPSHSILLDSDRNEAENDGMPE